jgi:hypothetical protein
MSFLGPIIEGLGEIGATEGATVGAETAGVGAAETAGATASGASTAASDFNDSRVGKLLGSRFGQTVTGDIAAHELLKGGKSMAQSTIGTGNEEHVNIGSWSNI